MIVEDVTTGETIGHLYPALDESGIACIYDEITNINENVYSCIGMTSNGLVSVHSTIKEWWLE